MSIKLKGSDKALASLGSIIEKFQNDDLGHITMACRIASQGVDADIPSNRWSRRNRAIAFMQSDTLDCRGAKQWKAAGRLIQKGGSAVYILKPMGFETDKDQAGNPLPDGETRYVLTGFKGIPVFPIHQTRPMTQEEAEEHGVEPVDYAADLDELPPLIDVAERLGVTVEFAPLVENGVAAGWYIDRFKHIQVGTYGDAHRTFFHELGHAVHYEVLRQRGVEGRDMPSQEKEAVAEMIAAVLADLYGGADNSKKAWHYIKAQVPDGVHADELTDEQAFELVAKMLNDIIDSLLVIHGEEISTA